MPNCEPIPVVSELKGKEYTEDNLNGVVAALKNVNSENVKRAINNSLWELVIDWCAESIKTESNCKRRIF